MSEVNKHVQIQKGLGALPSKLAEELKRERALNTLYKRVDKRNINSFKSLEKRLKKANELTPKLEQQFYALYSTLSGLRQEKIVKRRKKKTTSPKTVKPKRASAEKKKSQTQTDKGFWEWFLG